jgi:hypothetical protein
MNSTQKFEQILFESQNHHPARKIILQRHRNPILDETQKLKKWEASYVRQVKEYNTSAQTSFLKLVDVGRTPEEHGLKLFDIENEIICQNERPMTREELLFSGDLPKRRMESERHFAAKNRIQYSSKDTRDAQRQFYKANRQIDDSYLPNNMKRLQQ